MEYIGYVGTYTSKTSEGIYRFNFKENRFSDLKLFAKTKNPKYLCFIGDYIAAVCDFDNGSGVSVYDKQGNLVTSLAYESSTSCYIVSKGKYLYTCNYHNGTFSALKLEKDKLVLLKTILIKEKAGSHQVIFVGDKFLIPCLFLDKIIVLNSSYEIENTICFDQGSGPRHAVLSNDKKYLYIVGELSNNLYVIDLLQQKIVNTVHVLKNNIAQAANSAAIRMSSDGRYIYVSTRTEDVVSVLSVDGINVELQQVEKTSGVHPRDFYLNDEFLIVANKDSNNLVSFSLKYGIIDKVTDMVCAPEGVSIIMEEKI